MQIQKIHKYSNKQISVQAAVGLSQQELMQARYKQIFTIAITINKRKVQADICSSGSWGEPARVDAGRSSAKQATVFNKRCNKQIFTTNTRNTQHKQ